MITSQIAIREIYASEANQKAVYHRTAKMIFHLAWEGDRVPVGAVIAGREVAWAQHGIVSDKEGETIGTYEYLVQFGGASGREQQMIIFV